MESHFNHTDSFEKTTDIVTIDYDKQSYVKSKKLGTGGFGTTYLFETEANPPGRIAVKIFNDPETSGSVEQINWERLGYQTELKKINGEELLIMPYLGEISLLNYLKEFITKNLNNKTLVKKEILKTFIAAINELEKFHSKGFMHADAYYDNFLFDDGETHLVDFDDLMSINDDTPLASDIIQLMSSLEMIKEFLHAFDHSNQSEIEALLKLCEKVLSKGITKENKANNLTLLKMETLNQIVQLDVRKNPNSYLFPRSSNKHREEEVSGPTKFSKKRNCELM